MRISLWRKSRGMRIDRYFFSVTTAALELTLLPLLSMTAQRTCMPFHVSFDTPEVVAVVCPFHMIHEEAPAFL